MLFIMKFVLSGCWFLVNLVDNYKNLKDICDRKID